ncbi:carbohydrate ABC transporter permease [Microbacterium deminutum]|uniref:carbohydrate ABC transporter permease n=1 Tax=Microbacterium deminutum TaxID=344164 RepID=UPI0031D6FFCF
MLPFVFPLVAMIAGSFAGTGWNNYAAVLSIGALPQFFLNSAIIAGVVILTVYLCGLLAAFGFSKLRIRGKEFFFWLLLLVLMLPDVTLLTPLFTTATSLGIYDTYIAVILPLAALQIPFAVLLTRNFLNGLPDEFLEAVRVDGANTWQAFVHIVIPLTRPIAAAVVILTLINAWNNFLLPLVFLQSPDLQTVTLVPTFFVGQFSNDQTKVLAAAVLTAIPVVVAYLCLQRLFERGLAAGAIK